MNKLMTILAIVIVVLAITGVAQAVDTKVFVFDEASYGGPIGGFYSGSVGGPWCAVTYLSGDLNAYSFSGVNLLWIVPADNFTTAEIDTMASFLSSGGRIGFLGMWYSYGTARDNSINSAVASLGGHISINTNNVDNGYPHYAYRSSGRILSDHFTNGVNSFVYGLFSPLSLSGSAKALVLGEDGSSVLLAYENIGAGTIFVMGGQSAWDLDPYAAGTDNRELFRNILTPFAPTGASATDGTYTDKVTITWNASIGATAYDVYRYTSDDSASSVKINTSDITATSCNDTSAVAGTTYWYWVKARNSGGANGISNGDSGYKKLESQSPYGGGSGEPNDPYLIYTPEQLNTIGAEPNDWNKCFKLMADINMSAYTGTQYNIIGNTAKKFKGKFDGNNHVISNLTYDSFTDSIGLFGEISSDAEIKNLGLENVNIVGRNAVGALVGYSYQSTITNCYSTGAVNGNSSVGGLIGTNWSATLSNCHSTAAVIGTNNNIGGLIGYNNNSLSNCYATGNVNGWTVAGGLTGYNGGTINSCYSAGAVSGENGYAGGLIGNNSGTTVSNCYSTGAVSGSITVGGLIGTNSNTVRNCYSTGAVSGGTENFGGLVGYNNGGILKSFWNNQTSGKTTGIGGGFNNPNEVFGQTTAQMKVISTFTNAGWDFTDETDNGTDDLWQMPVNSYPRLAWETISIITKKFGNIPGEKNTKLTVYDSCTPIATFSLTGGGYGEVTDDASQITLYGTGYKSLLTISTPKGKTATISNITADGPIKGIMAKTTNLNGDIDISGPLGTLTLNNAKGSISIGGTLIPTAVAITFNQADGLNINSDIPIKSITALGYWWGTLTAQDVGGTLPAVGSITSKSKGGYLDIKADVDGDIGTIKTDGLSGSWNCQSVKSIATSGVDDFYLTLSLPPDPAGKKLALGKLTVKEYFDYSQIISTGNIGTITAGRFFNSICFAGVDSAAINSVFDLPAANAANFSSLPATIKSISIKGYKGESPPYFVNSNIAAANILSVSIAYPGYDNGNKDFGFTADKIKSLKIKDNLKTPPYKNLDAAADITVSQDAKIRIY